MDELQLSLLILPLLGGFLFASQFRLTSWYTARQDGERLIFISAIAGVLLLFPARIIVLITASYLPCVARYWKELIPFHYSGWAFIAFALGFPTAFLLNLLISKTAVLWLLMNYVQSDSATLEHFFYRAVKTNKQVMLTLKDGKVYVGYILENSLHRRSAGDYIRLVPTISGYRDPVTKEVEFSTSYIATYLELGKPDSKLSHIEFGDFAKLIPVSEIEIAGIFDATAYETFSQPRTPRRARRKPTRGKTRTA